MPDQHDELLDDDLELSPDDAESIKAGFGAPPSKAGLLSTKQPPPVGPPAPPGPPTPPSGGGASGKQPSFGKKSPWG